MRKDYGTLEDKSVLLDLVFESMEEGNGLSFSKACRLHGISTPSTALGWLTQLGSEVSERYARTQSISIEDYDDTTENIIQDAIDNPQATLHGIDIGFVGLIREMSSHRSNRSNARRAALKAKTEDVKPLDIGSVTVNLIQDSRTKE